MLVLEAGRTDSWWDVYIHMPAAFSFPIGNRRYDWCYASEPEPFMDGRRVAHARGKVLGGSSSINGMIFQRGNALDYEKWAAEPGLERWSYAHCLPYFKRMETCVAGADDYRGDRGPLVLERGPAANELFGAFLEATRRPATSGRPTSTAIGRRASATFDRNDSRRAPPEARRARTSAPCPQRPNLEVRCRALVDARPLRRHARGRSRVATARRLRARHRRRGDPLRRRDQLAAAPPAVGRRRSGAPALGRRRRRARAPGRRREPPGPPRGVRPARVHEAALRRASDEVAEPAVGRVAVAPLPPRARRDEPLRGGWIRALERGRRVPEPHVPLPAARDPLRRHAAGERTRLPGARRPDELGRARVGAHHVARTRAPTPRSGSTTSRPSRTAASGSRRSAARGTSSASRAFAEYDAGELSPGPDVETDEEILDWVARDAETALHPVLHLPDGDRRARRSSTPTRCACTASTASAWSTPP